MDDLAIFVQLGAALVLFAASGCGRTWARHRAILRSSPDLPQRRMRLKFSLTLAVMWTLFIVCNAILFTEDAPYAIALLVTAASSCKLRRVCHTGSAARQSMQVAN
jgi:hypothetical protein